MNRFGNQGKLHWINISFFFVDYFFFFFSPLLLSFVTHHVSNYFNTAYVYSIRADIERYRVNSNRDTEGIESNRIESLQSRVAELSDRPVR